VEADRSDLAQQPEEASADLLQELQSRLRAAGMYYNDGNLVEASEATRELVAWLQEPNSGTLRENPHALGEVVAACRSLALYEEVERLAQDGLALGDCAWVNKVLLYEALAEALYYRGALDEALRVREYVLEEEVARKGGDNPFIQGARFELAKSYNSVNQTADARQQLKLAYKHLRPYLGDSSELMLLIRQSLVIATRGEADPDWLLAEMTEVAEKMAAKSEEPYDHIVSILNRASVELYLNRLDSAMTSYYAALDGLDNQYPWHREMILRTLGGVLMCQIARGDREAAESTAGRIADLSIDALLEAVFRGSRQQAREVAEIKGHLAPVLPLVFETQSEVLSKKLLDIVGLMRELRNPLSKRSLYNESIARELASQVYVARRRALIYIDESAGNKGGQSFGAGTLAMHMAAWDQASSALADYLEGKSSAPRSDRNSLREEQVPIVVYETMPVTVHEVRGGRLVGLSDDIVLSMVARKSAVSVTNCGSAAALQALAESWIEGLFESPDEVSGLGEALASKLLMHVPLENNQLLISAGSWLCELPLDVLPLDGVMLGDKAEVVFLSGLGFSGDPPLAPTEYLLVGDLDYGAIQVTLEGTLSNWGSPFFEIATSSSEIDGIQKTFLNASGRPFCTALVRRKASKEALLDSFLGKSLVHISSHGRPLVWEESGGVWRNGRASQVREVDLVSHYAPLMSYGIALSGVNEEQALRSGQGFLTAEEFLGAHLADCELFVVSACEGGRSIDRNGEGLQSLRSALHAAGVRRVLAAPWRMDAEATREFMVEFYRICISEQLSVTEALWRTKKSLSSSAPIGHHGAYRRADWAGWKLTHN
jgi:hypothetical protein